jgi:alpha-L-fucosidase
VQDKLRLTETTVLSARCFRDGKPVSAAAQQLFTKVKPRSASDIKDLSSGLRLVANFDFSPRNQVEYFGFEYSGYIDIPQNGIYAFYTDSDDGSQLFIGEELVVDNDGLHGMREEQGVIPLEKGYHSIRVTFFEKTGGDDLIISIQGPGIEKQAIPKNMFFYKKSGAE